MIMFTKWKQLICITMICMTGIGYALSYSTPVVQAKGITIKKPLSKKATHSFDTNAAEAVQWAKADYGDWYQKLSSPEQTVISGYLRQDYKPINNYLWNTAKPTTTGTDAELDNKIQSLSASLHTSPLRESLITYRRMGAPEYGMELTDAAYDFNKPENIKAFRDKWMYKEKENPGFLSTTLVSDGAEQLNPRKLILRLYVPDGTKGAYVNFTGTEFGGEYEFLIDKGYKYIIDDITDEVGDDGKVRLVIDATLLPK